MENATLEINILPILSKLLYEQKNEDANIILLQTSDAELQHLLVDSFENNEIHCAKTYKEYKYAIKNADNPAKNTFHLLLNPTDWKEWGAGTLTFSKSINVKTIIIDNSFTATCMADEIWEVNDTNDFKN